MALRIPPAAAIEDHAAMVFLSPPACGELHAKLRLADARRADDNRQSARNQPAAQRIVESGNTGGLAEHC